MPKGVYERRSRLAVVEPAVEHLPVGLAVPEPVPLPEVRRWRQSDFDEWLSAELMSRWGGNPIMWRNKLVNMAASNDYLLITNEAAVLLAMQQPHPLSGKPVVMEVFAFGRDGDEAAIAFLCERMRGWARALNTEALRLVEATC